MRPDIASRRAVVALALVLAVGACADTRPSARTRRLPATPQPVSAPTVVPAGGPVEVVEATCSDTLESVALHCAEGTAVRRGDTLAIMLADGRVIQRLDNRVEGDAFVSFTYAGRLGGSSGTPVFHMLDVAGPESWAVELINAHTGDSVVVHDQPLLSPDGARFALSRMDLETCEGGSVLEVWRITGDTPVREFTLEPYDCTRDKGWGASELEWIARDTLGFLRNAIPRNAARRALAEYDTSRVRLVRGSSGWVLNQRAR